MMQEDLGYSLDLPWFKPVPWLGMANGAYGLSDGHIPSDEACIALLNRYDTMEHIKTHCLRVADFAEAMARRAMELYGITEGTLTQDQTDGSHPPCPADLAAVTRAAGILHDIAKSFCIRNGGSHAQLGASWVVAATGNHRISQAIMHHVEWPWQFPANLCSPTIFVGYADKRVRHDSYVTLAERYADLLNRYAKNDPRRFASIMAAKERAETLERALSAQLELPLHACIVDSGRLVPRA